NIPHIKKRGIEYFQKLGYKVFAFVDNEPENLKAVAEIDRRGEILLLHADTIFKSCKSHLKGNFVSGNDYEINKIISSKDLYQKDGLPKIA
ncbi:MAG: hypothetical protein N2596_01810, partial [Syntrophorhabdaceae bacterium]|nr:hypothetical protein [Syntrophorhabdaceae bacterium]